MVAGTVFDWLPNDNKFDPVPDLMPTGDTAAGSATTRFIPLRIGFFADSPRGVFEFYGRYTMNLASKWTVSGSTTGSGSSTFVGYGVGAMIGIPLVKRSGFRLGLDLNAEYLWQSVALKYTDDTAGTVDNLVLKMNPILAGVGLAPELYLGDQWVLVGFAGYQYGYQRNWKVNAAGTFLGNAYSAGALVTPSGGTSSASFGGFLFEAGLKLNFM